ncbi:MAG: hypothetical protein PVJ57_21100 [Phycisphaerae bacterium]|jgi:flagellar M-ring protein FliF
MGALQKLLARIVSQLRGLNLSQRLAIVLGGVLVAVSVIWMISWAATPEMVPLLDQDLEPAELATVRSGLELMNERFELVGQKVMVRADANRQVILAHLQQQDKLPNDTSIGFDALVKEANPWISQAEHERRWAVALKHEIEQVLSQFDGVRTARVFLPMATQSRTLVTRTAPAATASVTLVMQGGRRVSRELALAAARQVAGAVRGLSVENVEVLDGNGVSAIDWESESSGMSALDRKRREEERMIQKKIAAQLADPSCRVAVQVELEHTNVNIESETPSKPVDVEVETTDRETTRVRSSGQPGVQPNVGVAAGGRAADESTVEGTSRVRSVPAITRKQEATLPGSVKEVWAAVSLSHSYLASICRRRSPDVTSPTEEQVEEVFREEQARVVSQLTKLVRPQDAEHVDVRWHYDAVEEMEPAATAGSTLDETFNLVQRWGPQSGLGLLALLSLGLMLRMARKSDSSEAFGLEIGLPQEAIEAAQQAAKDASSAARQRQRRSGERAAQGGEEDVLTVGTEAVGQAAATEGVLVAQEVDERTVQTHKMLSQISDVVERDGDSTSALLEQWVQQTDSFKK